MSKSEIIESVAANYGVTKTQAKSIVEEVLGNIGKMLKSQGRASIAGLGTFTVTERKARNGRNPFTGEALKIKASKSVKFKPAPALKTTIAKVKIKK